MGSRRRVERVPGAHPPFRARVAALSPTPTLDRAARCFRRAPHRGPGHGGPRHAPLHRPAPRRQPRPPPGGRRRPPRALWLRRHRRLRPGRLRRRLHRRRRPGNRPRPAEGLGRYLKRHLEALLGCPVDPVVPGGMRNPRILEAPNEPRPLLHTARFARAARGRPGRGPTRHRPDGERRARLVPRRSGPPADRRAERRHDRGGGAPTRPSRSRHGAALDR